MSSPDLSPESPTPLQLRDCQWLQQECRRRHQASRDVQQREVQMGCCSVGNEQNWRLLVLVPSPPGRLSLHPRPQLLPGSHFLQHSPASPLCSLPHQTLLSYPVHTTLRTWQYPRSAAAAESACLAFPLLQSTLSQNTLPTTRQPFTSKSLTHSLSCATLEFKNLCCSRKITSKTL